MLSFPPGSVAWYQIRLEGMKHLLGYQQVIV